jgi:hypothetical protein
MTNEQIIEKLNELCRWLSHQKGMMSQDYAKELAKIIVKLKQTKTLSDEEIWDWFRKNTALTKESALRIARAIEERHGIK